jgi:hypothetical protein
MSPSELQRFKEELVATAEVMGRELSPTAVRIFAEDLKDLAFSDAVEALHKCRRSMNRFPSIADIIERIQASDGRPGVEEAWAMIPQDESGSVVWTEEMARAYSVAHPLLKQGDSIGARMAFKEKYLQELKEARDQNRPVKWTPSLGYDPSLRNTAIQEAVAKKRITQGEAARFIPELEHKPAAPALPGPVENPEVTRQRIRDLVASITKTVPGGEA